LAIQ